MTIENAINCEKCKHTVKICLVLEVTMINNCTVLINVIIASASSIAEQQTNNLNKFTKFITQ